MEKLPVKASECPLRSCRGRAGAGGSARVPSGWRRVGSLVITLMSPDSPRSCVIGFGVEQAPYGMQTQSYPKGGLLDGLCPASSAPSTLGPEQDFQMFPKARLSTVSVNYCSVGQDFPAGSLNLLSSASGETQAPERHSRWGWGCDFPGPQSDHDLSFLISRPVLCPWRRSRAGLPGPGHSSDAQRACSSRASGSGPAGRVLGNQQSFCSRSGSPPPTQCAVGGGSRGR